MKLAYLMSPEPYCPRLSSSSRSKELTAWMNVTTSIEKVWISQSRDEWEIRSTLRKVCYDADERLHCVKLRQAEAHAWESARKKSNPPLRCIIHASLKRSRLAMGRLRNLQISISITLMHLLRDTRYFYPPGLTCNYGWCQLKARRVVLSGAA